MKVYNYAYEDGFYYGPSEADESPLEPGVWLIPANATTIEPPPFVEGKTIHFTGGGWAYRDIPVPVPEPEPEPAPPAPPLPTHIEVDYRVMRARAYPSIGDQLDAMYHAGMLPPALAEEIRAVKERYPKDGTVYELPLPPIEEPT